jgi:hypothetical protein
MLTTPLMVIFLAIFFQVTYIHQHKFFYLSLFFQPKRFFSKAHFLISKVHFLLLKKKHIFVLLTCFLKHLYFLLLVFIHVTYYRNNTWIRIFFALSFLLFGFPAYWSLYLFKSFVRGFLVTYIYHIGFFLQFFYVVYMSRLFWMKPQNKPRMFKVKW